MAESYDIVVKNGSVVDGSGDPAYPSDVAITNGQVAKIAPNIDSGAAQHEIDAGGLVVCPGFIDTHTHDDLYVLAKPGGDDKVQQGVTTVIAGNCGMSVAPISKMHEAEMRMFFDIAGGKHLPLDDLNVNSFDDYLTRLENSKPGINIISLVGHSSVRIAVMGLEHRDPTKTEMVKMKNLVTEAMESGACGLSTGLIYSPGNVAGIREIADLAEIAGCYGGIYTTHMRSEGDAIFPAMEEAFEIGKRAKLPVHISHHKVTGKNNWGKSVRTLQLIHDAREAGLAVTCDQYPYLAGSTVLGAALPPSALGQGARLFNELLKDPDYKAKLIDTIETKTEQGWENLIKGCGFGGIVISIAPQHEKYVGKSIADIAEKEGKDPYEVFFELLIVERHGVVAIFFMMTEEDVERIMKAPLTMIGSDGIPGFGVEKVHPRQTSTFPRVLGRYVREKGTLSLEGAIRKMTSFPAQTFGLSRKGLLKEGYDADLVIFNPDTIIDVGTYDDPNRVPEGIGFVLVNGQIAVKQGQLTGTKSGAVLRRGINT